MLCRNWKGEMVEAPPDLATEVASFQNGYLVWSQNGPHHQVRYGLEVTRCTSYKSAINVFLSSMKHYLRANEGLDDL